MKRKSKDELVSVVDDLFNLMVESSRIDRAISEPFFFCAENCLPPKHHKYCTAESINRYAIN